MQHQQNPVKSYGYEKFCYLLEATIKFSNPNVLVLLFVGVYIQTKLWNSYVLEAMLKEQMYRKKDQIELTSEHNYLSCSKQGRSRL